MPDNSKTQRDAGLAEETRPVPSQAEGDDPPGDQEESDRPRPSQAEGEDRKAGRK